MTVAPGSGGGGGGEMATEPSKLAIELSDSAKQPAFNVPKSVDGGVVEITVTNSAKRDHSAQRVRAEQGHTPKEALAAGNARGVGGKAGGRPREQSWLDPPW